VSLNVSPSVDNLTEVQRTLVPPLVCRALESLRPDALLHDPGAVEIYRRIQGRLTKADTFGYFDQTATAMRTRQFDHWARDFLNRQPRGLVVDLGCGLDTRFQRVDNGQMAWLGIDLPEVIALRRGLLADGERCHTLAGSILDPAWMEAVSEMGRAPIFLAEGVFPYFCEEEMRPLALTLAERFPGAELAFDVLSSFSVRLHNRSSGILKESGARLRWPVDDDHALEGWGREIRLLEAWGYFDAWEPRLGVYNLLKYVAVFNRMNRILRYRLGEEK
jgi:O-methyltransferase involved in polyketide biosynthesis